MAHPNTLMSQSAIERFETWLGGTLPPTYRSALDVLGGVFAGDRVRFYSADELLERNVTYQTKDYCPGFFTIADDSGGRAVMIQKAHEHCSVYVVDHGSMDPGDFRLVASDLAQWIAGGCRLPEDR